MTWVAGLKEWVRRRPGRALVLTLFAGSIGAWLGYEFTGRHAAEERYRAAVAEADRLDPGWREGTTLSSTEPIPDDQNSANLVVSSYEQIPRGWDSSQGNLWVFEMDPARAIPPVMMAELRQRRDQAKEGLADARALADRPRGRFPSGPVELSRSMPLVSQQVRAVFRLLYLDGLVRIEDGDLLGATANVKAMINAGRAIGDQPGLAFQAARAHAVDTAVSTLERLLAHGELPEPVLADLQKLLESEASHPLALISWRGERAAADKLFEAVRTGRAAFASLLEPGEGKLAMLYTMRTIRENQARLLELNNRMVELAKLPVEQQGPAFNEGERIPDSYSTHRRIVRSSMTKSRDSGLVQATWHGACRTITLAARGETLVACKFDDCAPTARIRRHVLRRTVSALQTQELRYGDRGIHIDSTASHI